MKIIVTSNCVRCNPIITANRVNRSLFGVRGKAYISERTPNQPFQKPEDAGWLEIGSFDALCHIAKEAAVKLNPEHHNVNIFVKTASLGGRARFYIDLDAAIHRS